MHLFKSKRVSNPSPSSLPSLPLSSTSSDPSSSKRNSRSSKKTVGTISKLSKRTLARTLSTNSSTSSTSSWSCHGQPTPAGDSVLFGWNGADGPSTSQWAQSGAGHHNWELSREGNDLWWGRVEESREGGEELIREHSGGRETSPSRPEAVDPPEGHFYAPEGTPGGSRSSSSKEAGSLGGKDASRGGPSPVASSSPWSSSSLGSCPVHSSSPLSTSSSSLATSAHSSNWMSRSLRIDTEPLSSTSPSAMSPSVNAFTFPTFPPSSSSSSSPPRRSSNARRPSHADFDDPDPFACRPVQHERQGSLSAIPTAEPLHLSRQPQRPRVTSVQSSASFHTSSPSSVASSPNRSASTLPLPRPPRSSSRPKAANPSVTRITRERSSSNASMGSNRSASHSRSSSSTSAVGRGPPQQHPPPSRPPPPIPTASSSSSESPDLRHSSTKSKSTATDSSGELDGVWEGFLKDLVGMKVQQEDECVEVSTTKSREEKPLPAMPPQNPKEDVGFSVALNFNDRASALSGLAYLDEDDEDEAADEPFSLDTSFAASDYYAFSSNTTRTFPTSASVQSILSLEISAFNFPPPPGHIPSPAASSPVMPYHRPTHYSNLSTSSTMSSLSSLSAASSPMPVTPSFAPTPSSQTEKEVNGNESLWGPTGTVRRSPPAAEWREEEGEDDRTIAWGRKREERASEDSTRSGTEVAWGEAL